jgi:hypothetical protein
VLRAHVDVAHDDAITEHPEDISGLSFVFAADDDDVVACAELHRTSGAREMIF